MFSSVKNFIKSKAGKFTAAVSLAVASIASFACAEDAAATAPTAPTVAQIQTFISSITDVFTVSTILGILGGIVSFGIAYVFLYWAVRKALRGGLSAVKKGKLRV